MAKIGLIDIDCHNFPNIALMKISSYHKSLGDKVEWVFPFEHYDKIYKSKVFSTSQEPCYVLNCDEVVEGGTGYAITLENGVEKYEKAKDNDLPEEIEKQRPDYSIYPQYSEAYGHCTRGCPRGCGFCIVSKKEGRKSRMVGDVEDFWAGQKEIKLMDANLLACTDREKILKDLARTKARVDFTQGLDIRLTEGIVPLLNNINVKMLHFAWDDASQDLTAYFERFKSQYNKKDKRKLGVYVLTNYNTTQEEDLYRVYKLREMGFAPYVMVYDKANAGADKKRLQRYVNAKRIFNRIKNFEEYEP